MKHLSTLCRTFWERGRADDCPIYDMHGHMGPHTGIYMPYSTASRMVDRMERANVKLLAFSHHTALYNPEIGNAQSIEAARAYPEALKAYCVINPNYPELAEKELAAYEDCNDAYIGLKFHPSGHSAPLSGPGYAEALRFADRNGLPVLSHTWGGDSHCGEEEVRKIAGKYPGAKLIMGHSLHGAWEAAASIAREFPNAYLELCAVTDERAGILEQFVSEAGSEKILYGTDFPWFNHHYYIGAVLAADITDDDRRNIFYRNAKRLMED